ncbi:hypothetical protein AX16_000672 [Volvariella volvacea WC 439]|nr:hypothetical protein AX16_000672 [Volvariella volvacea WC 439]
MRVPARHAARRLSLGLPGIAPKTRFPFASAGLPSSVLTTLSAASEHAPYPSSSSPCVATTSFWSLDCWDPRAILSAVHHRPFFAFQGCFIMNDSTYQDSPSGYDQRIHMYKTYFGSTVALPTVSARYTSRGDIAPSPGLGSGTNASNTGSIRGAGFGRARALTTPQSFPRSHLTPGTPTDPWSTPRFPFTPSNSGMFIDGQDTEQRSTGPSHTTTHTRPHNYHHEWYNAAELVVGIHPGLTPLLYQQPLHSAQRIQPGGISPYMRTTPTFGHVGACPWGEGTSKPPQFLQNGVEINVTNDEILVNEDSVNVVPSPTPGANVSMPPSLNGLSGKPDDLSLPSQSAQQHPTARDQSSEADSQLLNHRKHQRHFALRDITNKPDSNKSHASSHAYGLFSNSTGGANAGLGVTTTTKTGNAKLKRGRKTSAMGKENRPELILAAAHRR